MKRTKVQYFGVIILEHDLANATESSTSLEKVKREVEREFESPEIGYKPLRAMVCSLPAFTVLWVTEAPDSTVIWRKP